MVNESRQAALDAALANAFPVPETPADLRAAVWAAVARQVRSDGRRELRELEMEHQRSVAALNARYLRAGRDALLAVASTAVLIGLAVRPLSHWLTPFLDASAPLAASLIALSVGVVSGAIILREFLRPPSIATSWRWRSDGFTG